MSYTVLFETPGTGVFTKHDNEESAKKHIHLLCQMFPSRNFTWEVTCDGEKIAFFPNKKKK